MTDPAPTPGTKMQYLIARRPGVSRDELVVNWFANHMPDVIATLHKARDAGIPAAHQYIATLYDPAPGTEPTWDGVAQLWSETTSPRPDEAHGTNPRDTFQQKAQPYNPWPTQEFVIVDGPLELNPNTLNDPYPCSRSGFLKVTSLLTLGEGADVAAFFDHWLHVHAPNVAAVMAECGAFRYAISQSIEPDVDPYVGMAELYFPDKAALARYNELYESDGVEAFVEPPLILRSSTEMVGVPGS